MSRSPERSRTCRFCGASASRWWPYCTHCDSLFGFPIVGWVIVALLGLGVYAMFNHGATLRL